ncbi:hypothetical protein B0S90_0199 [Caldicellulosiruptor bescii]|uniref:Uncharacterized protein n=2 Tax=Caldicellulosiruptor bescii TaxID=31899 RepID=B9MPX8_CALBD|nr:hypothetical protein [Caldicellulosiruptor bescii]ACM61761.1 hypothetical protein Athe_2707 [Caldicellulosiruptor bescii DSM 6725]PBC88439.1 hypothetical protein B0S87_1426 [Caldicellulosiruptor bescii]PBC92080.1 hypothetical protein B0S89_2567 [Caldicellulosiruptor bescii]PBD02505.1 hypothetical protein B0S85_0009 [Caldicellulosiruptor bescii]PBD05259.1 hypothetical protein B0S90_0199 [Caldicellulosiruptor bescii]
MILDPHLAKYLSQASVVEEIEITDQIEGVFLQANECNLPLINYPFRLIGRDKTTGEILFSVNFEKSFTGFNFIGAHVKNGHINFGLVDEIYSYNDFKEKALDFAKIIIENNLFELK